MAARKRQQSKSPRPRTGPRASVRDLNDEARLRRRLQEITERLEVAEVEQAEVVAKLRARRVPWEDIGSLTGMSRAGAHRKWGPSTTGD